MENTPMVGADDLPTILGIYKNDLKSRSVNMVFSGWILPQTVYCLIYQPKLRPYIHTSIYIYIYIYILHICIYL